MLIIFWRKSILYIFFYRIKSNIFHSPTALKKSQINLQNSLGKHFPLTTTSRQSLNAIETGSARFLNLVKHPDRTRGRFYIRVRSKVHDENDMFSTYQACKRIWRYRDRPDRIRRCGRDAIRTRSRSFRIGDRWNLACNCTRTNRGCWRKCHRVHMEILKKSHYFNLN